MTEKRKKVEEYILKTISIMDPSKTNTDRYKKIFESMDDKQFDSFMKQLRDKKAKLCLYAPNMKINLQTEDLYKAADYVGAHIFEKIEMYDPATNTKYTPPHEFMVLRLPIRRVKQYQMHKMSVPESDRRIDMLTGQVVKPDKAAAFSFVEMQIMHGRGLDNTIMEFMKLRGGDIHAYATMKQSLEETGEFAQSSLPEDSVNRSVVTTDLILKCMLIDNNYLDRG